MDLILWRHAEAHDAREGESDLDRALTAKGERQAQRMARWLDQRLAASARVLASPARRCQETVAPLDRKVKTVAALAPDASFEALLQAARWPDADEPVLVVGHQPTLGLAAAYLLTGTARPWTLKKAAVWWFRSRDRDAAAEVLLVAVHGPDGP